MADEKFTVSGGLNIPSGKELQLGNSIVTEIKNSIAFNASSAALVTEEAVKNYVFTFFELNIGLIAQHILSGGHEHLHTPTPTPGPTATPTPTPGPTATPSPTPTATVTQTPTQTPTVTPTPTPSPTASPTPTATVTQTPTQTPTVTPSPTAVSTFCISDSQYRETDSVYSVYSSAPTYNSRSQYVNAGGEAIAFYVWWDGANWKVATGADGGGSVWWTSDSGTTNPWESSWTTNGGITVAQGDCPVYSNNYSLDFDGTDDHLTTTFDPDDHDLSSGFTYSTWVNLDTLETAFFAGRMGSSSERFTFGMQSSTVIFAGIGGTLLNSVSTHNLTTGTWHHFCITYDGSTANYYLDGSSQYTWAATWSSTGAGVNIRIGSRSSTMDASEYPVDGKIDETAIWNTALGSTAVTDIYNSGIPMDLLSSTSNYTVSGNLVAWWRMGEHDAGQSTITDASTGSNTATLVNSPGLSLDTPS